MKNRYLLFLICLGFTCGKALALPQEWSCDEIDLSIVADGSEWGHKFKGNNGLLEITIDNFDENKPYVYNCGNSGCWGTIKNLETGEQEHMRFDCLYNSQQKSLQCYRIDGDEYLLTKISADEYRVQLCGSYFKYLNINQCLGCTCILHDSRGKEVASDMKMNCLRENNTAIRCFSYDGYEKWRDFKNKDEDFEKCTGLGI